MINPRRFLGGSVAVYRGQHVKVSMADKDHLRIDGEVVSMNDLDEMYGEDLVFRWRGEEFVLGGYRDGILYGRAARQDLTLERVRELGLVGDPREGWGCEAPEGEVESARIETFDVLGAWRDQQAMGEYPSPRFYTDMRPLSREEFSRL